MNQHFSSIVHLFVKIVIITNYVPQGDIIKINELIFVKGFELREKKVL